MSYSWKSLVCKSSIQICRWDYSKDNLNYRYMPNIIHSIRKIQVHKWNIQYLFNNLCNFSRSFKVIQKLLYKSYNHQIKRILTNIFRNLVKFYKHHNFQWQYWLFNSFRLRQGNREYYILSICTQVLLQICSSNFA